MRKAESAVYGLYGIVVHSGTGANSGHYNDLTRSSMAVDCDSRELLKEDSEESPWRKFNDERVTSTDWDSIVQKLRTSLADTSYMLFYRKVSGVKEGQTPVAQVAGAGERQPWVMSIAEDNAQLLKELRGKTPALYDKALKALLDS